ncbi:MAG TPA: tRNA dihydrouridine(20/20a) synthase DusA [Steroidobacteraceae bacterium]|nr:tRNA dihydrouridine(20/20a) synthase DusA [Steroidobacteraceae bacterium]
MDNSDAPAGVTAGPPRREPAPFARLSGAPPVAAGAGPSLRAIDRRLSAAPMMDWSDRHCRHFFRLLAPRALLYTEMIVAGAVLRGDRARLLDFDSSEHPVALQLGGADPATLAMAARIGAEWGYDEINLNVGCPSERVQAATFGACLMARPALVADCIAAMRAAVAVPVTVKCRIGIDDEERFEFLLGFVDAVAATGCETFIVHARKAILAGLSPKQNREIPPLRYETVWRLKAERPALTVIVNGGIRTPEAAAAHWARVDGVMIGREAYHNPYFLAELDRLAWPAGATPLPAPAEVVAALEPYVAGRLARGERLHAIARHVLGLYAHRPGARAFRRVISELGPRRDADFAVLAAAVRAAEGAAPLARSA